MEGVRGLGAHLKLAPQRKLPLLEDRLGEALAGEGGEGAEVGLAAGQDHQLPALLRRQPHLGEV